jgi:hypothetical protein
MVEKFIVVDDRSGNGRKTTRRQAFYGSEGCSGIIQIAIDL